ncbi:Rpn family recombination-promoting nuclease/putative transposase [Aliidiomarina celeris]|uniref:Rpn family recombination-promoting nuclease/putative transposase n=1 Tax=Aliidiomarina celeris TaxID=2249428 RepID=UPI000DE951A2|nr:Rpn family recombination-promoting nuclease/putative transposase [Aliidiomarina celeris]
MDASRSEDKKLSSAQRKSIDASYKLLFSEPKMVIDLLQGYVKQEWIERLDFSTLQAVPTDFVSSRLHKRQNDCIWRVQWRDTDRWLYVYVVLEFQSTPDRLMPLRLLTYLGLLYEKIAKQKEFTRAHKLPPVLPMVLYNGKTPWNFVTKLYELIDVIPGGIEQFIPRFEFLLLEEYKYKDHPLPAHEQNLKQ